MGIVSFRMAERGLSSTPLPANKPGSSLAPRVSCSCWAKKRGGVTVPGPSVDHVKTKEAS